MRLEERRFFKVSLPVERFGFTTSPNEGVWVYHLADGGDVDVKQGGVGMLLNEPFEVEWARAGFLVSYVSSDERVIPYVASARQARIIPLVVRSEGNVPWSDADLRAWARDRGGDAKRAAIDFLVSSQRALRKAAALLPDFPSCERCGGEWSSWLVRWRHWTLVGRRWSAKRLCWGCYRELTKDKGGARRPLSEAAGSKAMAKGEIGSPTAARRPRR